MEIMCTGAKVEFVRSVKHYFPETKSHSSDAACALLTTNENRVPVNIRNEILAFFNKKKFSEGSVVDFSKCLDNGEAVLSISNGKYKITKIGKGLFDTILKTINVE
jgi:hypothetical protein